MVYKQCIHCHHRRSLQQCPRVKSCSQALHVKTKVSRKSSPVRLGEGEIQMHTGRTDKHTNDTEMEEREERIMNHTCVLGDMQQERRFTFSLHWSIQIMQQTLPLSHSCSTNVARSPRLKQRPR